MVHWVVCLNCSYVWVIDYLSVAFVFVILLLPCAV